MMDMFSSSEVRVQTGVTEVSLNRWSQILRDTHMVIKSEGRVLYHPDFVRFIETRIEQQGPSGLPEAQRIADLYRLYRELENDVEAIADTLGEPTIVVLAQLNSVGIEHE